MTYFPIDPEEVSILDGDAAAALGLAAIRYVMNDPASTYEHEGSTWWPGSIDDLAALTGLKYAAARRVLGVLVKAEFITTASHYGYDRTKSIRLGGAQVSNSTDGVEDQQIQLSESTAPSVEIDISPSVKEVNSFKPQAAPKGPLPEDWTPTVEHEAVATELGWTAEERAILFRLHYSLRKTRHTRTEWDAAFELWLRSGPRNQSKRTVAPAPSHPNPRTCSHDWQPLPGGDARHLHCRHCKALPTEVRTSVRG